jgi:hypothetical protein
MKIAFFVLSLTSITLAADFKAPAPPSPAQVFENLVMGEEAQTSDGRFWSLICGTLGNARGESFITVSPPEYPPQLITDPITVQSPFPVNLSAYTGQYVCFYEMIGNKSRGYFALTTPGDEFYRTPLPTMRFSVDFTDSLWPEGIKKVSFFYDQQHIGTVRSDTPDTQGRRCLNEAFPNPQSHYIDPKKISFTIHYQGKRKSAWHPLNPSNPELDDKFKPDLTTATPLTKVPHAIRFRLNFKPDSMDVSLHGRFDFKQIKTQPLLKSIHLDAPSNTPENDKEILDSLPFIQESSYMISPDHAAESVNYDTYLDLARSYMQQASAKYNSPVHMPTALRTLRSAGRIPASSYLGLILMELQRELGHGPENTYYPAPLT